MLLIIGATGKIGSHLVEICKSNDTPTRLAVRDLKRSAALFGDESELVLFDLRDPDTFQSALHGVDSVFMIAPNADAPAYIPSLLTQMEAARINHLVFSSGRTTGDIPGKSLFEVEQLVRTHRIPATILRPGWFMQNFLGMLDIMAAEGKFYLPAGMARTAFIDVRDIAAVAYALLTGDGFYGQTLELTSEEALNHDEVAKAISSISGRAIQYEPLKSEAYVEVMTRLGRDREKARYMASLYEIVLSGKEAVISHDVRRVLHRSPHSFARFLNDYEDRFRVALAV